MSEPVVYFVRIGKWIKIGTTTDLKSRLSSFRNSSVDVEVLLTVPGGRDLEQKLHDLLDEARNQRELFHPHYRIYGFIDNYRFGGMERAMQYLDATTPSARKKAIETARGARHAEARRNKAEKDAYFASLVAERKQRLGW